MRTELPVRLRLLQLLVVLERIPKQLGDEIEFV